MLSEYTPLTHLRYQHSLQNKRVTCSEHPHQMANLFAFLLLGFNVTASRREFHGCFLQFS